MSAPSIDPADLLDLKLVPAWVKEPSTREDYTAYEGEELPQRADLHSGRPRARDRSTRRAGPAPRRREEGPRDRHSDRRPARRDFRREDRPAPTPEAPLELAVQFIPRPAVLENVV